MDLEHVPVPFGDWFQFAIRNFIAAALVLIFAALVLGYLVLAARLGPVVALRRLARTFSDGVRDLTSVSLRRVGAIAGLTIRESTRRYVVIVVVVFLVFLLFAVWFLERDGENPARLYLSTVLNVTNLLTFLLALFLSAFSIPNDIKSRTMYTVVTKPVRASEIVLGRVLGFTVVCTVILALIGISSYVFVQRGLDHSHTVVLTDVETVGTGENAKTVGRTSYDAYHRHEFTLNAKGIGETDSRMGHVHYVERGEDGEIRVGAPEYDSIRAKQPIYGEIEFLDRSGKPADRGINPGKEYKYRGYVEGQTESAAIWHFSGLEAADFPDGIPLEMTLRVFRTHKGDIEKGIVGSVTLFNPLFKNGVPTDPGRVTEDTAVRSKSELIVAQEFSTDSMLIQRDKTTVQMPDNTTRVADVFNSLVHDGKLDIRIQCDEPGQYYGMAKPDLYIRAASVPFGWNFFKSYYSIWLQLVIIISLGVMMSTFLNGSVAMLASFMCIALGFNSASRAMSGLAMPEGGGLIESMVRLVTQKNQTVPFDPGPGVMVMQWIDSVIELLVSTVASIMPNFRGFPEYAGMNTIGFAASGFDIPVNLLAQHTLATAAYVLIVSCLAYAFLKSREVAA
jgi:ABC-type transport system involved in multi-copper enzyme maturation permease subunit